MSGNRIGMDAGRGWWWAVLRTERDRQLAAARGRPIGARNLRRLLMRRLGRVFGEPIEAGKLNELMSRLWGEGKE